MQISKDALWKGIIESLIEEFMAFFFPDFVDQIDFSRKPDFLDTELEKLMGDNESSKRLADKLIRLWLKSGIEHWFLAYVEAQDYSDKTFGCRMFEGYYRVRDKYKRPVTSLAIYTNSNRKFHFTKYEEEFWGTKITHLFNAYILLDNPPEHLALNPNPFAAVMEAAWMQLKRPKDEQTLYNLKLDLVKRLKARNIPEEKAILIIEFIRLYTPFTTLNLKKI
jgi:hypothetical protein